MRRLKAIGLWAACSGILSLSLIGTLRAQGNEALVVLPGLYQPTRCTSASFPDSMPPIDSVLNVTRLTEQVAGLQLKGRAVLGLRLGALRGSPAVRILESKLSSQEADSVVELVQAALGAAPPTTLWAFRLRIDPDPSTATLALERSRVCAPRPEARSAMVRTELVTREQANALRDEAALGAMRRRTVRFRVLVGADGKTREVELTRSSGDQAWDVNYAGTLKQRRFVPGTLDGVAVAMWVELTGDN